MYQSDRRSDSNLEQRVAVTQPRAAWNGDLPELGEDGKMDAMSPRRPFIVIADDFTGACDTGVQLARHGAPCPVVLWDSDGDADANAAAKAALDAIAKGGRVVFDTESRHLPSEVARERVEAVCAVVTAHGGAIVYKKVDSTLRGNLAAEIEAVGRSFPERVIVVAPAFPAAGRTTITGLCMVGGTPVNETEFARDSRSPVRSSRIADFLCATTPVTECTAAELETSIQAARGGDAFVVDAATNEDLAHAAQALLEQPDRAILVGSAGFAAAIVEALSASSEKDGRSAGACTSGARDRVGPSPPRAQPRGLRSPVLGLVGSLSEVSRRQLDALNRYAKSTDRISLTTMVLGDPDAPPHWVVSRLAAGESVFVATPPMVPPTTGASDASVRFADSLGRIAREAAAVPSVGFFATGGDTAVSIVRALDSSGVLVHREIEPGVPLLTVGTPIATGRGDTRLITKAGGFGDEETIIRAVETLQERTCWQ